MWSECQRRPDAAGYFFVADALGRPGLSVPDLRQTVFNTEARTQTLRLIGLIRYEVNVGGVRAPMQGKQLCASGLTLKCHVGEHLLRRESRSQIRVDAAVANPL